MPPWLTTVAALIVPPREVHVPAVLCELPGKRLIVPRLNTETVPLVDRLPAVNWLIAGPPPPSGQLPALATATFVTTLSPAGLAAPASSARRASNPVQARRPAQEAARTPVIVAVSLRMVAVSAVLGKHVELPVGGLDPFGVHAAAVPQHRQRRRRGACRQRRRANHASRLHGAMPQPRVCGRLGECLRHGVSGVRAVTRQISNAANLARRSNLPKPRAEGVIIKIKNAAWEPT